MLVKPFPLNVQGLVLSLQNLSNTYLVCLSMFVLWCIVQDPKVVKCKDGVAIYSLFSARVYILSKNISASSNGSIIFGIISLIVLMSSNHS